MNIGFDDVALLAPFSKNRGIGNYAADLFRTLEEIDHENQYYMLNIMERYSWPSPKKTSDNNTDCCKNRIVSSYHYLGKEYFLAKGQYRPILGKIVKKFIEENNIDIFIITSPFDDHVLPYDLKWFEEKGVRVIAIVYDIIPYVMRERYLSVQSSYEWYMSCVSMLEKCDRVAVISESVKDDLVSYLNFDANKIDIIWGASNANIHKIDVSESKKTEIKKKFGINKKFIMCTGGDDERKNIAGLIEAYGKISEALRSEYQLTVVCKLSKESERRYKNLATELHVDEDVVLTNFVSNEELICLYNMGSLMAFPSKYEGFGLPVVEAFACDMPVLTSNNSSLVQIAGDAAVLVDPFSIDSIAAGLEEALTAQNLKQFIVAGRKRLEIFQWKNVAKLLLDSVEKTLRETRKIKTTQEPVVDRKLKRIAYFTPLPPIKSGISDYSVDVITELSKYCDIDVFIDNNYKANCQFPKNVRIFHHCVFNITEGYDEILYHMGNSEYHFYMYRYIREYPGIVVLHDYNLHGAIQYDSNRKNSLWQYSYYLREDYSLEYIYHYIDEYANRRGSRSLFDMPVNGFVTNYAKKIIVHSNWCAEKVLKSDIQRPVYVIPFYSKNVFSAVRRKQAEVVRIGVFGFLADTKRIMPIANAFLKLQKEYPNTKLIYVGEAVGNIQNELYDFLRQNKLENHVTVTGYTTIEDFQKYMTQVDICLNLRYPYQGETSASLLRLLGSANAVIVNDIGSFSEFPDDVCVKIPDVAQMNPDEEIETIYHALKMLIVDEKKRERISKNAASYVKNHCSIQKIAKQYLEVLTAETEEKVVTEKMLINMVAEGLVSADYTESEMNELSETLAYVEFS